MRCVVIPATPLLVRAAAGRADPLANVRDVVRHALEEGLAAAGDVVVLGTGPAARSGRLRPTLAAIGVADARVPALAGLGASGWAGLASTGPSVALLALADAGVDLASSPVDVVEVPAGAAGTEVAAVAERLCGGLGDRLVVAADHPAAGVDAVLATLLGRGRWTSEVHETAVAHEHLPAAYRVTVHHGIG